MTSNLITAIHRRLGLSVTQLGVLDSLTLRLVVGQTLTKEQIFLLFDDSLRRDVEAVLATYFEENEEGFVESEEVRMMKRAASQATEHRPECAVSLCETDSADVDTTTAEMQALKKAKAVAKAKKAAQARWERHRAREALSQAPSIHKQPDGAHGAAATNAPKQSNEYLEQEHDAPKLLTNTPEHENAILQANASNVQANASRYSEQNHQNSSIGEHSKHISPSKSTPADANMLQNASTPSTYLEHKNMLQANDSTQREHDVGQSSKQQHAQMSARMHGNDEKACSEHQLKGDSEHVRASSRAYARASDPISDLSDSDPIRSDRISNQKWEVVLRARGFAETELKKYADEFEKLIGDGFSIEDFDDVVGRVIASKPDGYQYAVRYLLKACQNELEARRKKPKAKKRGYETIGRGRLVKEQQIPPQTPTLEQELATVRKIIERNCHPFMIKCVHPEAEALLMEARVKWLLDGKPIEGISFLGEPCEPQNRPFFGVEDAKARVAQLRGN